MLFKVLILYILNGSTKKDLFSRGKTVKTYCTKKLCSRLSIPARRCFTMLPNIGITLVYSAISTVAFWRHRQNLILKAPDPPNPLSMYVPYPL